MQKNFQWSQNHARSPEKKRCFLPLLYVRFLRIIQNYMEVSPAKSLILSATIHGGSYFFHSTRICERYEPCKIAKNNALQVYLQGRLFLLFYRATAREFYSLAVHGVTFSFALNFLDLTTFLRQILGKIYSSDFLTTFYDNGLWFIPQQVSFRQIHFRHLILHVRLLCNMIVDIHCNLCI